MLKPDRNDDQAASATREKPSESGTQDHRKQATAKGSGERPLPHPEHMDDEEKVLAGRLDANIPALLTKDVPGG